MNQQKKSLFSLLMRLWNKIPPFRRFQILLSFIIMILASFAEVISIGAVLPFLSAITSPEFIFNHHYAQPLLKFLKISHSSDLILPLTVCFSVAILLAASMRLLLLLVQTNLSHKIGADFSLDIYRRTLFQNYAVHVSRNSSEVISGISNKANSIIYSAIYPILTIVNSFLMLVMILGALMFISPIIALSTIVGFGSIYALVISLTRKRLSRDSLRSSQESTQVIKALQEGLGGIRDVLLDGTQNTFCQIYKNADIPLRRAQANIVIVASAPRYGIEALGMIFIAVIAYIQTTSKEQSGALTIPVLGALALGAQRLLPILQQAYYSWATIKGGEEFLRDTMELLDQPILINDNEPVKELVSFNNNITLDSVSFRYNTDSPLVINNMSLTIPKGARVGIIGVTGSGKSTVLDIIMSLLKPSSGNLMIDGVNISHENYRSWQAHIAHVPQSIYLADATILENIAFGIALDEIDFDRVKEAAYKAQIAETIESWDNKYLTKVGERGVRLSGGQRQRIGIARALYKKADVIIFDEATSALDNLTENEVMSAIENLGTNLTIIIVAHRLTTLKSCSKIFELEAGNVINIRSYNEILEKQNKS